MDKLGGNIKGLLKNKRIKVLGIFIVALALFLETPIRIIAHKFSESLLNLMKETILAERGQTIIKIILTHGSPLFFVYFPALIGLIFITRNGFQKIDWVLGPFLIGILLKGGIYGMVSLKYLSGEFWELKMIGVPNFLLSFFLYLFILVGIYGIYIWLREILTD